MKIAYGYCRASTGKQSLTFEAQRDAISRYFQAKLEPEGWQWGGFFEDKATSGGKPFNEREQGLRLYVQAQQGDCIIWAKMDRAFRSVRDGANTLDTFDKRGIAVHSLDISMDTGSALGKFIVHLFMMLGELERNWVSMRTREAQAAARAKGLPSGKTPPAGWKIITTGKTKQLVQCPNDRLYIDKAWHHFRQAHLSIEDTEAMLADERRTNGGKFHLDFLSYAFHARALGYPVQYCRVEHRAAIKLILPGKGRHRMQTRCQIFADKGFDWVMDVIQGGS